MGKRGQLMVAKINLLMTHNEIQKLIYDYIKHCEAGHSEMLTGYQLEGHIRSVSGEERTKVRRNILEVFDKLYKRGELSYDFCEKIIENDDCPCGFKEVLGRNQAGKLR